MSDRPSCENCALWGVSVDPFPGDINPDRWRLCELPHVNGQKLYSHVDFHCDKHKKAVSGLAQSGHARDSQGV